MKISIIIPVYNAESFIKDAIESIQNQTSKSWELILIDDGSTDKSLDILKKFETKDKRIKVFSQNNSGPMAARKKGVKESSGDWITFLDSDDCLELNALSIFKEKTKHNNSEIFIFSVNKGWKYFPKTINFEEFILASLEQSYNTGPVSKFYKRNLFNNKIFDVPNEIRSGEDWIMNIRLAFNVKTSVTFCNEIIYNIRTNINTNSITKIFKYSWDYDNIYAQHYINSIPLEYQNKFIEIKIKLLSRAFHNKWRKTWCLPKEAKESFIYIELIKLLKNNKIKTPYFEKLDRNIYFPIFRFGIDIVERCFGIIKKYKPKKIEFKYYKNI